VPSPFVHTLRVRYLECDPQGVVGHPRYLGFFDVAMTEMWREAVGAYQDMVDSGTDLVVAETSQRYWSPARFDDLLEIEVGIAHIGNTSIVIAFDASVEGRRVVSGTNRYVAVGTGTNEKKPVPDEIRSALAPYAAESPELATPQS